MRVDVHSFFLRLSRTKHGTKIFVVTRARECVK
jgi:hypothetical protein